MVDIATLTDEDLHEVAIFQIAYKTFYQIVSSKYDYLNSDEKSQLERIYAAVKQGYLSLPTRSATFCRPIESMMPLQVKICRADTIDSIRLAVTKVYQIFSSYPETSGETIKLLQALLIILIERWPLNEDELDPLTHQPIMKGQGIPLLDGRIYDKKTLRSILENAGWVQNPIWRDDGKSLFPLKDRYWQLDPYTLRFLMSYGLIADDVVQKEIGRPVVARENIEAWNDLATHNMAVFLCFVLLLLSAEMVPALFILVPYFLSFTIICCALFVAANVINWLITRHINQIDPLQSCYNPEVQKLRESVTHWEKVLRLSNQPSWTKIEALLKSYEAEAANHIFKYEGRERVRELRYALESAEEHQRQEIIDVFIESQGTKVGVGSSQRFFSSKSIVLQEKLESYRRPSNP